MNLLKIGMSLDTTGFKTTKKEIEVKEGQKSFVADGIRVSKEKILKIDTIFIETSAVIKYHIFCFESDEAIAVTMLRNHILAKTKAYKEQIDLIYKYVVE